MCQQICCLGKRLAVSFLFIILLLYCKDQPKHLLCQKLHLLLPDLSVAEVQHNFLVSVLKAVVLSPFRLS